MIKQKKPTGARVVTRVVKLGVITSIITTPLINPLVSFAVEKMSDSISSEVTPPEGMRIWEAGTIENPITYTVGELIYHNGGVYRVIQSHENTGDLDWAPDIAIALFEYLYEGTQPPAIPENAVILYDEKDGNEVLLVHTEDEIAVPSLTTETNDKVSSVKLPAGKQITLYQHTDYKGTSVILRNNSEKAVVYNLEGDYAGIDLSLIHI